VLDHTIPQDDLNEVFQKEAVYCHKGKTKTLWTAVKEKL